MSKETQQGPSEENDVLIVQGDLPTRVFNAVAKAGFAEEYEGEWYVELSTLRGLRDKMDKGHLHIRGLGEQSLGELNEFLEEYEEEDDESNN